MGGLALELDNGQPVPFLSRGSRYVRASFSLGPVLPMPLLDVLPLALVDAAVVEPLLDEAFGPDRHQRTAYRLREGTQPLPDLSFAMLGETGELAALLQSWPVALTPPEGASVPLVLVGPVAVAPRLQGRGLGRGLMERLLVAAETAPALMLIGDPEYYGRFFGFSAEGTGGWTLPGPVERRRLLARPNGHRLPTSGALGPRR